jgi:DNA-binding CsgD family transcriptional regulator/PAS domain-containing protein
MRSFWVAKFRSDDLDRLIGAVHETALAPELWPDWFSMAAAAFYSSSGLSLVQSMKDGTVDLLGTHNFGADSLQLYAEHYHQCNLWAQRLAMTPMHALLSADLCTDEEFANSEIYNDLGKRQGNGGAFYVVGAVFPVGTEVGVIGFHHTRSTGPFARTDARALDNLLPHFRQALQIRARLKEAEQRSNLLQALVDSVQHGIALVARDGTLLYANVAAQELLRQRDGLSLATGGRLVASRPADTNALRALVVSCTAVTGGGALSIPRPSGARPLEILAAPLSTANRPDVPQKASAIVFLHDPEIGVEPLPGMLASLYRLTPAESRLATELLGHLTLAEIAERRQVSLATLRTQLKRLFGKTGTTRQSELIGLLTAGAARGPRRQK